MSKANVEPKNYISERIDIFHMCTCPYQFLVFGPDTLEIILIADFNAQ